MVKKALITGITGQDGSYLSDFLLEKGYEVHGLIRRSSCENTSRISHIINNENIHNIKFFLHFSDLTDSLSVIKQIEKIEPDEIYNLAAQSDVKVSFEIPEYTTNVVALGTLRLLEAIHQTKINTKFYQASSSELYGKTKIIPQDETTQFNPISPYAISKLYAYYITKNYRESYNIHASNGILFNHESPRRGENFVTRKITKAIAKIVTKKQKKLFLGNIEAKRDWGYAKDYVEAMWKMVNQPFSDDYVIATGKTHSVKEFLEIAFNLVNLNWMDYVEIDENLFRPSEVDILLGNAQKAKNKLGWTPKTSFSDLVKLMLEYDLKMESKNMIKL